MRINYVLIDLENIQLLPLLAELNNEQFRILVFVGANQSKVSFELAYEMQKLGTKAEYIKIAGNGNNALDFHIAYYIGKISTEDPSAYFHIISKDTGFDPLIQYLKTKQIGISRSNAITDIPLLKTTNTKPLEEKIASVISNLKQRSTSKPCTLTTLSNTIMSLFKDLSNQEMALILAGLKKKGFIVLNGNKVSYTKHIDSKA